MRRVMSSMLVTVLSVGTVLSVPIAELSARPAAADGPTEQTILTGGYDDAPRVISFTDLNGSADNENVMPWLGVGADVAGAANGDIFTVDPDGGSVSRDPGGVVFTGCPNAVAVDANENVYVSEAAGSGACQGATPRIVELDRDGTFVQQIASGTGASTVPNTTASLHSSRHGSMSVDGSGDVFFVNGSDVLEVKAASPGVAVTVAQNEGELTGVAVTGDGTELYASRVDAGGSVLKFDLTQTPPSAPVNTISTPGEAHGVVVDEHGYLFIVGGTDLWRVAPGSDTPEALGVGDVQVSFGGIAITPPFPAPTPPSPEDTTTTLSSSDQPATAGEPITLTATVRGVDDTIPPDGDVEFLDANTFDDVCHIADVDPTDGTASCSLQVPAGGVDVIAIYADGTNYNASDSFTYTVSTKASLDEPSVSLMGQELPATPAPVRYDVTVSGGSGTPQRGVVIDDGHSRCTLGLDDSGQGSCSLTESAGGGPYTVRASYLGDDNYLGGDTTIDVVGGGATAPDAPTIGTASSQSSAASVAFTPPASDGGSAITGYDATCSSSDGGTTAAADGTASPISVSGVTVGSTYTCTVTATNDVGTSGPSGASNSFVASGCAGQCLSVGDASVLEGDSKTRTITFPVTLSAPSATQVTVHYAITGVSATGATKQLPGNDFKLKSGTVTFALNSKGVTPIAKTVTATVFADPTTESNETLIVALSGVTGGYALGRSVGTGTILNDDGLAATSTIGIGDGAIVGAASGSQSLKLPVTLSAANSGTVTVTYAVSPESATYSTKSTGGGDFGGKVTGTITFAPGATKKTVSIPIWADPSHDPTEGLTVTLSGLNGSNVTLVRSSATGTILGGWH